jgi:uncharacterized Zn ribbon protein
MTMKRKLLLTFVVISFFVSAFAQRRQQMFTAYAITGAQKGSGQWSEVRLINLNSGEEIRPVYQSSKEFSVLNARTGMPIVKKDLSKASMSFTATAGTNNTEERRREIIIIKDADKEGFTVLRDGKEIKNVTINKNTNGNKNADNNIDANIDNVKSININKDIKEVIVNGYPVRRFISMRNVVQTDKPFATYSAACAYDKKNDRLYYTPIGINQLRYIDLNSKETKILYFEDEAFGALASRFDVPNQITRMVFGSDGNGYALTNNANHLIKFTTNKKAQITDLGSLNDDAANGTNSIHNRNDYGGDMVAGNRNNLYLVTANHNVFKINIDKMIATYKGSIKGLPAGFTTNGAAVEKETSIIVSSSNSTSGFYKFDLNTLHAEKLSASNDVYSSSDLANGNLLIERKIIKPNEEPVPVKELSTVTTSDETRPELLVKYRLAAYPNPVVKGGSLNLSFNDFPRGRYQVQLMDLSGKLILAENLNVGNSMQLHLLLIPKTLSQGTYFVKIVGEANKDKVLVTEQVAVQ